MSSATTNRPTGGGRTTRFGDFNSAANRANSDDRNTSASSLGQTFGNGGAWQPSSGIWGNNAIGSGLVNAKRDASRSRAPGSGEFGDAPSGSAALTQSSEADLWTTRANGPWNPPDTTSPTSHSGSTSPSHIRTSIPNATSQNLLDIHNYTPQSRSNIIQGVPYGMSQPKSSLDPSSGSFKFVRKHSFPDDKENPGHLSNVEIPYDIDNNSRAVRADHTSFLRIGGNASRDGSIPPSRASDTAFNGSSSTFGSGNQPFGSIGHTPSSSIHSQRPSFSDSYPSQTNTSKYTEQPEIDLREKFSGLGFSDVENSTASHNNNAAMYSPSHPNFAPSNFQLNPGSVMWNEVTNNSKGYGQFESFPSQTFADQPYFNKTSRYDRGSISPAGSDYRRGLNSPKYYSAGTPPSEQIYRPGSRGPRIPHGPGDRLQNVHFTQQSYFQQFQGQYPSHAYDYPPPNYRQNGSPYGYMQVPVYTPTQVVPTRPAKDQDVGVGVRSVLLEEFRSNSKSNKRYDLKDIYHHVVEFSGDQHGSRFIQQKLETANSDEKEQLFREIQPNALQLMTDVFGNYVIQKLFEHGNQVQKRVLAEQMKNHVMELSMQMYGCRVVQKALEHVLADQQAELVTELQADVLKCVKDQNGNHVVQKAIERVPTEHIQFVIEAFKGQIHILATHPYGCRVIQRILEFCKPHDQAAVLEELHHCASMLITDQYGNYVTQHVITHGKPEDRTKIINLISAQLLTLSKHKFASNVVEKSIQFGTDEQRKGIVSQFTAIHSDGTSPLQLMMKDQYGNYVIQKLLLQLKGAERDAFVEDIKPQLISLKKYNYGKQIAAIEKLIFTGPQAYITPSSVMAPATQTMPIEINSSTPTPMLTNGQNSPQSSLPSASVSTIDDPSESASSGKTIIDMKNCCPEVVISGE